MKVRKGAIALAFFIACCPGLAFGQEQSATDKNLNLHGQINPQESTQAPQESTQPSKQGGNGQAMATGAPGTYESPDTSKDLRPESLVLPSATPPKTAKAEIVLIKAEVTALKANPVERYRGPHLRFFEMHFKNGSDEIAIIDGDNTQAVADKGAIRHANASAVIKGASNNLTPNGKALVTGVSLLSLGLAGPIFYEMMTPQEHAKRYLGRAIGVDGVRQEIESGRFGRRLIMPGDETTGWVAFESPSDESIKSLKIPVWFSPMRSPATYLELPVKPQGASL
jgi:hypothetical protein